MSFLNFNLSGFGLDISDFSIKIAQVVEGKGERLLSAWGKTKIKPGVIDKGVITDKEQLVSELKKLKESVSGNLTSNFAVACLPETKTFIKVFDLSKPKKTDKKESSQPLIDAIEKELPKEIPLPVENITYDFQIVREDDSSWSVLVGAAPRDIIMDYNEVIKSAGFSVLALEIEAQAIVRALMSDKYKTSVKERKIKIPKIHIPKISFGSKEGEDSSVAGEKNSNLNGKAENGESIIDKIRNGFGEEKKTAQYVRERPTSEKPTMIVDLGAARSGMIVYHGDSIRLTRSIPISGSQITKKIMDEMKLTPAKAEQAKIVCGLDERKCKGKLKPIIDGWVNELAEEISTTMTYYHNSSADSNEGFKELLLCGGGAALNGLSERLSDELSVPASAIGDISDYRVSFHKEVPPIPKRSVSGFATAIGLALRSV